jgi:hypothetical protein
MRKYFVLFGLLLALAIPATALAVVNLHDDHVGTTCADGGSFHFVANGVDGAVGSLTVEFNGDGVLNGGAGESVIGVSVKFNQGTNHWTVDGIGTLTGAWATVGKMLVLSDFTCDEKKDEPPK